MSVSPLFFVEPDILPIVPNLLAGVRSTADYAESGFPSCKYYGNKVLEVRPRRLLLFLPTGALNSKEDVVVVDENVHDGRRHLIHGLDDFWIALAKLVKYHAAF